MNKPRLADLCCSAGGASVGYSRAGFDVVGVDIKPQPHYMFPFIQADALDFMAGGYWLATDGNYYCWRDFDAFHTSPPCQDYSKARALARPGYLRLIEPMREILRGTGKPYVIENVETAPLVNPTLLCGASFGLRTYRHRLFETSFPIPFMMHYSHGLKVDKSSGKNRQRDMVQVWGNAQYKGYRARASAAMGIDWMNEHELAEAIPPAYTEFIGAQLINYVTV